MNINIINATSPEFERQLADETKAKHHIAFNSKEDVVWDVVMVYENLSGEYNLKCRNGGLLFISGEPPMSNIYSTKFLNQFDSIATTHPRIKHRNAMLWHPCLPWHYGRRFTDRTFVEDYNSLKGLIIEKSKDISAICSFKKLMPGHARRNTFMLDIKDKFPNIDLFGRQYRFIDDKAEAIAPYRFHICMENTSVEDYWSEKLADTMLGYAVPIYVGCTNIEKYFDTRCMIVCKDEKELEEAIKRVMADPEREYNRYLPYLVEERKKLFKEYNVIETIEHLLHNFNDIKEEVVETTLRSNQSFSDYKRKLYLLRAERFIHRYI